tara:strand:+ start:1048 stop:1308 length:261 start_codon:yes stop_codon:yes gene_type:complete
MIRGSYVPARRQTSLETSHVAKFITEVKEGKLDRDKLLSSYFSLVYAKSGSYRAAGRQLGVDWRTVKEIVDADLARQFAECGSERT